MARSYRKYVRRDRYIERIASCLNADTWLGRWYTRYYGSIERYVALKTRRNHLPAKPGEINAPAHYRRQLNRNYRTRANAALRNCQDYDSLVIEPRKRNANWLWF